MRSCNEEARALAKDFRKWASKCSSEKPAEGLHLHKDEQEHIANLLDSLANRIEQLECNHQLTVPITECGDVIAYRCICGAESTGFG